MMDIDEFELRYLMFLDDVKKSKSYISNLDYLINCQKSQDVINAYESKLKILEDTYSNYLVQAGSNASSAEEAFSYFSKALNYKNTPDLLLDVAQCLAQMDYLDLARAYWFRTSLTLDAENPKLLQVMSLIEHCSGNYQAAIDQLRKLNSDDPDINYKLATYLIEEHNFSEGWKLYESRFTKKNSPVPYPQFSVPRWDKSKAPGVLLVHWEQGFGDTIMFSRFLPLLKPYAKKIYFAVRPQMKKLMQFNFPDVTIVSADNIPSDIDYHLPLMSIINALELSVSDIDGKSYLSTRDSMSFDKSKKVIGLSWQGSPSGSPERNMTLLDLELLLKRKDFEFVSFQKGVGLVQAKPLFQDLGILDMGSSLEDFYSTACALKNVDLMISTDNCVANLSGALGVPTILLLNKNSEFRWMHADKTTEWYDSVHIIKQKTYNNWESCVAEIINDLEEIEKV